MTPLSQIELFARELLMEARRKGESEERFRGRVARESTTILIHSVMESQVAKERLGLLKEEHS